MAKSMDIHEGVVGITLGALEAAHAGDLANQAEEGVGFGIPPAEAHELTIEV